MDIVRQPHIVKARKPHYCDYCRKEIIVGEEHEVGTYTSDGIIYDWRGCNRCKSYVEEAFNNKNYNWDDGMSEERFLDYMTEEHYDVIKSWSQKNI